MNILQINNYTGPDDYCPPYRPVYLANQWAKEGHRVTIVTASYSHLFHSSPVQNRTQWNHESRGVRYILFATPRYTGNGVKRIANLFGFVAQVWRHAKRIELEVSPDVVIAGSVHGLDCFPARRIARDCGATFVRDVRDLWPLTLTEIGGLSVRHPFVRLLQWTEDYTYTHADRVVTTLANSRSHIQQHGLIREKWTFIPQGIDLDDWDKQLEPLPPIHQKTLAQIRQSHRFVIAYAGGHGTANALDTILAAAREIVAEPIALVLVGQGPEKESLQKRAAEQKLGHVFFLPSVPRPCIPNLLRQVDATIIAWQAAPIYRFGISPNKVLDYMAAGKPILHATPVPDDLVQDSGCGIAVPVEQPQALAAAIREMASWTPEKRARVGALGRAYVESRLDYKILAQRYLEAVTVTAAPQINQLPAATAFDGADAR